MSQFHPALAKWGPEVRETHSDQELRADPDYKLVETCTTSAFSPPLQDFDKLVDTVTNLRTK